MTTIGANAVLLGIAALVLRGDGAKLERFLTSLAGISLSAVATVLSLSGAALVGAVLSGEGIGPRLRLARGAAPASAIACGAFASSGGSIAFSVALDLLHAQDGGVLAEISRAVVQSPPPLFAVSLIALAALPAIGEEIFFRGFVQTRLEARWGRWPAIATSAALFGLIHFDLKQSAFAFGAGLLLGWIASRARSTRPAMLVHCTNNLGSLLLARAGVSPATTPGKAAVVGFGLLLLVVGVVGFALQTRAAGRGGDHSSNVA